MADAETETETTTAAHDQAETAAAPDGFAALGLDPRLLATLAELGYEEPTPIQRAAIPPVIAGRDLVGQAATGTGKTAAFALPILQRLAATADDADRARPAALVLVPTRELAMQVAQAMHRYGRPLGTSVLPIYGGQAYGPQLRGLERGVDVVVATPGRALDHIERGTLKLGGVAAVVLDEADEMLDMGFADDIESILKRTPDTRQTLLFSATMPPRIAGIAKRHLREPATIKIGADRSAAAEPGVTPKVRQVAYVVARPHKLAALGRILDVENPTSTIIFCRTRNEVDELAEAMNGRGYRAEALHGGLSQEQRDRVMKRFRGGASDLLIATDVAARGLDIEHLSHVVNYDVPTEPESYVHRIGRVGRAGREGVALTLAEPRELRLVQLIERVTKRRIPLERLPTVADLRARRLELTRESLREAIGDGGLERFRPVVEALAAEHDIVEIALAAIKLAHGDGEEEREIPEPSASAPRGPRADRAPRGPHPDAPPRGPRAEGHGPPPRAPRGRAAAPVDEGDAPPPPRPRAPRAERSADAPPSPARPRAPRSAASPDPQSAIRNPQSKPSAIRPPAGPMARLRVSAGRLAGVRPQDLVGAIAGEAGLPGRAVGAIEITDHFSIVEVPAAAARDVIQALKVSGLRGHKVRIRPVDDEPGGR